MLKNQLFKLRRFAKCKCSVIAVVILYMLELNTRISILVELENKC